MVYLRNGEFLHLRFAMYTVLRGWRAMEPLQVHSQNSKLASQCGGIGKDGSLRCLISCAIDVGTPTGHHAAGQLSGLVFYVSIHERSSPTTVHKRAREKRQRLSYGQLKVGSGQTQGKHDTNYAASCYLSTGCTTRQMSAPRSGHGETSSMSWLMPQKGVSATGLIALYCLKPRLSASTFSPLQLSLSNDNCKRCEIEGGAAAETDTTRRVMEFSPLMNERSKQHG